MERQGEKGPFFSFFQFFYPSCEQKGEENGLMGPIKFRQKALGVQAGLRMSPVIRACWTDDETTTSPETGVSWHLCHYQSSYWAEAPDLYCQTTALLLSVKVEI